MNERASNVGEAADEDADESGDKGDVDESGDKADIEELKASAERELSAGAGADDDAADNTQEAWDALAPLAG